MSDKKISIYDTTLRDGAQSVGISFSLQDKIVISRAIDRLRFDFIEGGCPGSNPKDDQFFREIRKHDLAHSKIAAFGFTRRQNTPVKEDPYVQALASSKADVITIVAKTWDFQVEKALNIGLDENLNMIYETVAYLKERNFQVFMDAEHFFDGFKANQHYSMSAIHRAIDAGADMIVLCDTNGGTLPHEAQEITAKIVREIKIPVGVHYHNDAGVAVANSIASVMAGAVSVQGTVNGLGERCGNCDLIAAVPNLVLKMGRDCAAKDALVRFTEMSRLVSETANVAHNDRAPFVGGYAFSHKGGVHVSALQKDTKTYEHIDPALVGNKRDVLISELSGKSNIEFKAQEMGIDLKNRVTLSREILHKIKSLEEQGFQFEGAEGSFELILREATGEYIPFFNLKGFRVITEKMENGGLYCEATIKVDVKGRIEHTAANGNGPVAALDNALRKALEKFYPEIRQIQLSDYKVRVLNEKGGTSSVVRVLIDQKRDTEHWGTVGVSANIIEASWQALVDGIEFMLFKQKSGG